MIVHVTNSAWHAAPGGWYPYADVMPTPHSFSEAQDELRRIGARFIGVAVDRGGHAEEEAMAVGTGTVDAAGLALVTDAVGGTVSDTIVHAIETLVDQTPQDVTTATRNVPGNPDDFDATQFIAMRVPVEGVRDGVSGPSPGVTYTRRDETTFYALIPGTQVEFSVTFQNTVRHGRETPQIFVAEILVVGNGVTTLDLHRVYVIVPPDGTTILI